MFFVSTCCASFFCFFPCSYWESGTDRQRRCVAWGVALFFVCAMPRRPAHPLARLRHGLLRLLLIASGSDHETASPSAPHHRHAHRLLLLLLRSLGSGTRHPDNGLAARSRQRRHTPGASGHHRSRRHDSGRHLSMRYIYTGPFTHTCTTLSSRWVGKGRRR